MLFSEGFILRMKNGIERLNERQDEPDCFIDNDELWRKKR